LPIALRILVVVIDLSGGVGVFCRNLATGLKRYFPNEFHLSLLLLRPGTTTTSDNDLFDQIQTLDLPVHDDWRRFTETIPTARRLRRAIATIDSDLIFAIHNHPNLLVPVVAPKRRTILSVHGHLSTLLRQSITRPILRFLIRQRYQKHLVIVQSQGVANDLAQNFNVTNTRIIPHGIDIDRIIELPRQSVPDLPQQPYIVTLGRLVREKDHATLIRAFATAKKQNIPHRLVLIGSGEEQPALESLASSLNLQNDITFLGHRDNPYPYLAHADFFVLSSISEGFGLALVEALALGLPCISTNCPSGPAEILGNGDFGILVPPRDPDQLARAIVQLTNSPDLRASLSSRASTRAQSFSLETMARHYRDLFLDPNAS
jgi:glycosyltransferase involved in cell wall biosynthesis